MKTSDLTPTSVFYNIEHLFTLGDGSIKGKFIFQVILYKNSENKMGFNIEVMDIEDVTFLGNKIPYGYNEFKQFKTTMLQLGVDVNELLDKEENKFIEEFNKNKSIQLQLKKHFEALKLK